MQFTIDMHENLHYTNHQFHSRILRRNIRNQWATGWQLMRSSELDKFCLPISVNCWYCFVCSLLTTSQWISARSIAWQLFGCCYSMPSERRCFSGVFCWSGPLLRRTARARNVHFRVGLESRYPKVDVMAKAAGWRDDMTGPSSSL